MGGLHLNGSQLGEQVVGLFSTECDYIFEVSLFVFLSC